jgi:hypothetical protein
MSNIKAFVSKPVTVRAVQWTGSNLAEIQAFMAPASPHYQPGYERQAPMDAVPPVLHLHVPDEHANEQWPATGPHFRLVPVPLHGWLVVRVDDAMGFLQVLTNGQMTAEYAEDVVMTVTLPDGVVRMPSSQTAAFRGEILQATHPRAATTSDPRVAAPSREPAADAGGATIDRESES